MTDLWFPTYTGLRFNFTNPKPDQICIRDMARSLSMQVRYNGHLEKFYTIAEHSVRIAKALRNASKPDSEVKMGLLHDGEEAYTGDLPRPLKLFINELCNDVWDVIARQIRLVIFNKYGLPDFISPNVKALDDQIIWLEEASVLAVKGNLPPMCQERPDFHSRAIFDNLGEFGWSQRVAEEMFLSMAEALEIKD